MKKMFTLRPLWFNTAPAAPTAGATPPAAAPVAPAVPAPAPVTLGTTAPAAPATVPAVVPPAAPAAFTPPVTHKWFEDAPESWRDSFVQSVPEDQRESAKSILARVPSLPVFATNYVEAQRRLSKGLPPEDAVYLPKNATPEQLTEYRKKADVPEKFEDYQFNLDEGLTLGKEDREFWNPVFAVMHAANIPNPVASTMVNEYLKLEQKSRQAEQLRDQHNLGEAELALKKVWGVDYARNLGLVEMFLVDLPADFKDAFRGARLPDGTALLNAPEFWQFFLQKQKELNPMATVTPATGRDGMKSIDDEIKLIESKMGTDEYIKNEPMRARYRELIQVRQDMETRGQAR